MSKRLLALAKSNPNCADCGSLDATWFNFHLKVFVCVNCAGVHRGINLEGVRVKSVELDKWSVAEVAEAENSGGNDTMNEQLESFLPYFYHKLGAITAPEIRKEFILHKYVKHTFRNLEHFSQYLASAGKLVGSLEKKGKDKSVWKERHFILTPLHIQYYIEKGQSVAKGAIPLSQLEFHLETHEFAPSCLVLNQLTASGVSGRRYYVRGLRSGRDSAQLFDWYFALLAAHSATEDTSIGLFSAQPQLGPEFTRKSGNLYKVGAHRADLWKERWVVLNGSHLTYSKDQMSHAPQGDIRIGSADQGFRVEAGTNHLVRAPTRFTFQLVTPSRTYKLCADSSDDMNGWLETFARIINRTD